MGLIQFKLRCVCFMLTTLAYLLVVALGSKFYQSCISLLRSFNDRWDPVGLGTQFAYLPNSTHKQAQ